MLDVNQNRKLDALLDACGFEEVDEIFFIVRQRILVLERARGFRV